MNETDSGLKRYYFTFGYWQHNAGCVLPIWAKDMSSARDRMFELHGTEFVGQYNEEHWELRKQEAKDDGWQIERELPEEFANEVRK